MDKDSQLTDPTGTIVDLTEEHQEKEFHTPIPGENQINQEGGTDAALGEDKPFHEEFDKMLDVTALYADVLGPNHAMDPVRKVVEETQNNDAADLILPPPTANAENEEDLKVSDTSRIATNPSMVVASDLSIADNTSTPTNDANAAAEPPQTITIVDPTITTAKNEPRVEVY